MAKPERVPYDPAQPMSFCSKCLQLAWVRKRLGVWTCAKCTRVAMDREKEIAAQTTGQS